MHIYNVKRIIDSKWISNDNQRMTQQELRPFGTVRTKTTQSKFKEHYFFSGEAAKCEKKIYDNYMFPVKTGDFKAQFPICVQKEMVTGTY